MIIDCHGHYTTAPGPHQKFRDAQLKHFSDRRRRRQAYADISDDEIRESIEENQIKLHPRSAAPT